MVKRGMPSPLSLAEVRALHDQPLPQLFWQAASLHRQHHDPCEVQLCALLSVKTGGCPEDCAYCAQSSRYSTPVRPERGLSLDDVLAAARRALAHGATRFCMGAAWRQPKDGPAFDDLLAMIRGVRALGLEACVTLGMLDDDQVAALKQAGLTTYNHNLDSSRSFYGRIVSTHSYDQRLQTLSRIGAAGIQICSGGIIGMGESLDDRCELLRTLAGLEVQPTSVPINLLMPIAGTPLEGMPAIDPLEVVRMVATARLLLPRARVRLSAGRSTLSREAQLLCILAGANSIFFGGRLLTTENADMDEDLALMRLAGLRPARAE